MTWKWKYIEGEAWLAMNDHLESPDDEIMLELAPSGLRPVRVLFHWVKAWGSTQAEVQIRTEEGAERPLYALSFRLVDPSTTRIMSSLRTDHRGRFIPIPYRDVPGNVIDLGRTLALGSLGMPIKLPR
jgi:hypothetical protein